MKSCPTCNRTYPDDTLAFCLVDGSVLSAPYDPGNPGQATAAAKSSREPTEVLTPSLQPTITSPHSPAPLAQRQSDPSPERHGKKLPLFLIVSAVVIMVVTVGLYLVWPSASLGKYKGSLSVLFPGSLGNYQLDKSRNEDSIKIQLKAIDSWLVSYQPRDQASTTFPDLVQSVKAQTLPRQTSMLMIALNFSSVENAKAGLQDLRKALADATVIDEGTKKKGLYTVGDRIVLIPHQQLVRKDGALLSDRVTLVQTQGGSVLTSETKVVAWTNGSILFLVQDTQNRALEMEGIFPY